MTPFWQTLTIAIISALSSGGVVSLVQFFVTRHDKAKEKEDEEQSETSKMILALGHDKIACLTRKFIRRGGITQTEMANLAGLYAPYRAMGGNGDGKAGYEACEKLPIIADDEADRRDIEIKRKEYGL